MWHFSNVGATQARRKALHASTEVPTMAIDYLAMPSPEQAHASERLARVAGMQSAACPPGETPRSRGERQQDVRAKTLVATDTALRAFKLKTELTMVNPNAPPEVILQHIRAYAAQTDRLEDEVRSAIAILQNPTEEGVDAAPELATRVQELWGSGIINLAELMRKLQQDLAAEVTAKTQRKIADRLRGYRAARPIRSEVSGRGPGDGAAPARRNAFTANRGAFLLGDGAQREGQGNRLTSMTTHPEPPLEGVNGEFQASEPIAVWTDYVWGVGILCAITAFVTQYTVMWACEIDVDAAGDFAMEYGPFTRWWTLAARWCSAHYLRSSEIAATTGSRLGLSLPSWWTADVFSPATQETPGAATETERHAREVAYNQTLVQEVLEDVLPRTLVSTAAEEYLDTMIQAGSASSGAADARAAAAAAKACDMKSRAVARFFARVCEIALLCGTVCLCGGPRAVVRNLAHVAFHAVVMTVIFCQRPWLICRCARRLCYNIFAVVRNGWRTATRTHARLEAR